MVADFFGRTIVAGDRYALAGLVRHIDASSGIVVVEAAGELHHLRGDDVARVTDLAPVGHVGGAASNFVASAGTIAMKWHGLTTNNNNEATWIPVRRAFKTSRVAAFLGHNSGTGNPDWTLQLWKNGSVAATCTVDTDPGAGWTKHTQELTWSTEVTFASGDRLILRFDGGGNTLAFPVGSAWLDMEFVP